MRKHSFPYCWYTVDQLFKTAVWENIILWETFECFDHPLFHENSSLGAQNDESFAAFDGIAKFEQAVRWFHICFGKKDQQDFRAFHTWKNEWIQLFKESLGSNLRQTDSHGFVSIALHWTPDIKPRGYLSHGHIFIDLTNERLIVPLIATKNSSIEQVSCVSHAHWPNHTIDYSPFR